LKTLLGKQLMAMQRHLDMSLCVSATGIICRKSSGQGIQLCLVLL
jgi:hypothetical protein